MTISFEIDGKKVSPNNLADSLMAAILRQVEDQLREKIGSIRDPETGEFPVVVVRGRDLEHLSVDVQGSERLVALVKERLGISDADTEDEMGDAGQASIPVAFLCHASEDKETVRRLAADLMAAGIDVFFDEWEIRSGDSLRRKIDDGLGKCTHFIAVLSPVSIQKPWVNAEMDAAFVRKMDSEVTFIALRLGLGVERLPPLLKGSHSPALNQYDQDVQSLISDIHGISRKPPLGPAPRPVQARSGGMGLSPAAETIVKLMLERSVHAESLDPQLEGDTIREATGLIDDDIEDAADELEGQGFVRKYVFVGSGTLGFSFLAPKGELFARFDQYVKSWDPSVDAVTLASKLLESDDGAISVQDVARELGWEPRRMNPAIHYLITRRLVDRSAELGSHPWVTVWLRKSATTRRFVRDRG